MIDSFYNYTASFYQRVETANDLGGQVITYANVISTPCYITNISSDEREYAGKDFTIATHELSCSYTAITNVTTDYVCRIGSDQYDILDIITTFKAHHAIFKLRQVISPQVVNEA